jgi:hypothetical protein
MELIISKTSAVTIWLLILVTWKLIFNRRRTAKAPGIGYGSIPFLGPWRGAFAFLKDPQRTLDQACAQYPGGYFRISTHSLEYVVVASKQKLAEYLPAPDDVLSFEDQVNEFLQTEWTLGYGVAKRPYHVPLIRTKLTQTIASNIPAILLEVQEAMMKLVVAKGCIIFLRVEA